MRLLAALLALLLLTAEADATYWVGGTGTWDASTTTHWSASSGGAGGAPVPTSGDPVTFDANSGAGGVVTIATNITVFSIDASNFNGTLDWSINNNNVTISSNFIDNSSVTRTLKMGSGTWTFIANAGSQTFNVGTSTGLTLVSSSANLVFSAVNATGARGMSVAAGFTFGSLTISANASNTTGYFQLNSNFSAVTFGSLSVAAPNFIALPTGQTVTITNAITISGTPSAQILFGPVSVGNIATLALTGGGTFTWTAWRDITGTGTFNVTNSFDLGRNVNITVGAPTAPLAGGGIIGGG